jgi:hypothetical protein
VELGKRWNLPESWVRDGVRKRSGDPIPCVRLGRYVKFQWGAPVADLGGKENVSAQQMALVEMATRTRLYVEHLDFFLMGQESLVNKKRKSVLPVLRERQGLVDSLARILGQLGLERRAKPVPDLNEYLEGKYSADGESRTDTGTGKVEVNERSQRRHGLQIR